MKWQTIEIIRFRGIKSAEQHVSSSMICTRCLLKLHIDWCNRTAYGRTGINIYRHRQSVFFSTQHEPVGDGDNYMIYVCTTHCVARASWKCTDCRQSVEPWPDSRAPHTATCMPTMPVWVNLMWPFKTRDSEERENTLWYALAWSIRYSIELLDVVSFFGCFYDIQMSSIYVRIQLTVKLKFCICAKQFALVFDCLESI